MGTHEAKSEDRPGSPYPTCSAPEHHLQRTAIATPISLARDAALVNATTMVVTLGLPDALDLLAVHQLVAPLGMYVAALQGNRPSLVDALSHHHTSHPDRPIVLVGYSNTGVAAARSWLKRVAGHWLRTHPAAKVYVSTELVTELTPQAITQAAAAKVRPVTGAEAGLTNPTWQDPPTHQAHLLVCQGPRCLAKGGRAVADTLYGYLQLHGIADDCLITLTGCLYPCNRAPVVCVQPFQEWQRAEPDKLDAFAIHVKTLISNEIQPI